MAKEVLERKDFESLPPIEQIEAIHSWSGWEEYYVLEKPKTLADLVELYKFIQFDVGVEFLSSVYEIIDEEEADGNTTTQKLVDEFNGKIGYKLI